MTPPQSVTDRYIRCLLCDGQNDTFEIGGMQSLPSTVDNIPIGIYFTVTVVARRGDFASHSGIGANPIAALRRALSAHGVTFR